MSALVSCLVCAQGILQQRMIPRLLEATAADPAALSTADGSNLDPHKAWEVRPPPRGRHATPWHPAEPSRIGLGRLQSGCQIGVQPEFHEQSG
jgi:hypothetical protein